MQVLCLISLVLPFDFVPGFCFPVPSVIGRMQVIARRADRLMPQIDFAVGHMRTSRVP